MSTLKRTRIFHPNKFGVLVASVAIASGLALAHAITDAHVAAGADTMSLDNVSQEDLAIGGLTLTPVTGVPAVSQQVALATASGQFPGMPARQVLYAHLADKYSATETDSWIIDLTPLGGIARPAGPADAPDLTPLNHVLIVAIDARTGEFLFGRSW